MISLINFFPSVSVKCDESEGRATNALQLLAMSMGAFCALLQNSFVCCKRDAKKKKAVKGVKERGEGGGASYIRSIYKAVHKL